MPALVRARRSAAETPSSVMTTSTSAGAAKRTAVSTPNFEASASATTRWPQPTIARFTAASSGSGVVRPWSAVMPLVPRNATSTRRWESASTVSAPTAAWVVDRTRPGSSLQVEVGLAGQPCGDRDGMGDDRELAIRGEEGREPHGRRPRIEQDRAARGREPVESGAGDALLGLGVDLVALTDAGLDEGQRARGYDATVDPAYQPEALE